MLGLDFAIETIYQRNAGENLFDGDESGFDAVIEIGGVVRDFVDKIDELGFQRRALVEKIFGEFRIFGGGIIARMFHDAFANLEGQIQSGKGEIALLETFY